MPPPLGSKVEQGAQLIGLYVPELEKKIQSLKARIESLTQQYGAAGFDPKMASQQPIFKEQVLSTQGELDGLIAEYDKLNRKVAFAGTVIDVDPDLFLGEWVSK
jgi:putative peptide zinc metalloprotease protein